MDAAPLPGGVRLCVEDVLRALRPALLLLGERIEVLPWSGGIGGRVVRLTADRFDSDDPRLSAEDPHLFAELDGDTGAFAWSLDELADSCADPEPVLAAKGALAAVSSGFSGLSAPSGYPPLSFGLDERVLHLHSGAPRPATISESAAGFWMVRHSPGPCGATAAERSAGSWLSRAGGSMEGDGVLSLRAAEGEPEPSAHERLEFQAALGRLVSAADSPFPPGPIGKALAGGDGRFGASVVRRGSLAALLRHGPWPTRTPTVLAFSEIPH